MKKEKDKWAIFDLDDTLNDLKFTLKGALKLKTGKLIPTTEWDKYDVPQYGLSKKELLDLMQSWNLLVYADPNPYFIEMFKTYKAMGYKLGVITARKCFKPLEKTEIDTRGWLIRHGVIPINLDICNFGEKGKILKQKKINVDVFVDDSLENCIDVKKKFPKAKIYLRDQPWNQGDLPEGITRIKERS